MGQEIGDGEDADGPENRPNLGLLDQILHPLHRPHGSGSSRDPPARYERRAKPETIDRSMDAMVEPKKIGGLLEP